MMITHPELRGFVTGSGVAHTVWRALTHGPRWSPGLVFTVAHDGHKAVFVVTGPAQYGGFVPVPLMNTQFQLLAPWLVPHTGGFARSKPPVLPGPGVPLSQKAAPEFPFAPLV